MTTQYDHNKGKKIRWGFVNFVKSKMGRVRVSTRLIYAVEKGERNNMAVKEAIELAKAEL